MIIELFGPKHYDGMLAITRQNMAENFPRLTYNETKFRREFDSALVGSCGMALFVAIHNDEIVGYVHAVAREHAFADGVVVSLRAIYVRPSSRGSSAAVRLMSVFNEFSRQAGAVETHVGVTSGYHTEQARRFFEKLGYTYVGPLLIMNGEH